MKKKQDLPPCGLPSWDITQKWRNNDSSRVVQATKICHACRLCCYHWTFILCKAQFFFVRHIYVSMVSCRTSSIDSLNFSLRRILVLCGLVCGVDGKKGREYILSFLSWHEAPTRFDQSRDPPYGVLVYLETASEWISIVTITVPGKAISLVGLSDFKGSRPWRQKRTCPAKSEPRNTYIPFSMPVICVCSIIV